MAEKEKRKKRLIFIGASMEGKTTLTQAIMHEEIKYRKTQVLGIVGNFIIDTPGEYLERGSMRGALWVASTAADMIVMLQSAISAHSFFPPSFSSMFNKPVVGVVTKADKATQEQIEKATKWLNLAGADRVFITSAITGEGLAEFTKFLEDEGSGIDKRENEEEKGGAD